MMRFVALIGMVLLMGAASDAASSTDVVGLLREFGFPIFVSLWFMWRVEKRFDRFTDVIQNLFTAVTVMTKTFDTRISSGRPQTIDDRPSGATKAP